MPARFRPLLIGIAVLALAACATGGVRTAPPPSPLASRLAESITIKAIGLTGTPYRYGGNTPAGGFDCSGLIGYVYREGAGVTLPRSVREIAAGPWPKVAVPALSTGDVVFFSPDGRGLSHAGIYVGEGRFVHAPATGGTVRLDHLDRGYWATRVRHGLRILR